MSIDIKKKLKKERNRTFLAKDFESLRSELLTYARTYYPDKIKDFSEASMGGLLLDMASFVGDTLTYYLDHQFTELNPLTSVERKNILLHLRNAGVRIVGASPAAVNTKIYIKVNSEQVSDGSYRPKLISLPKIQIGTVFRSITGIKFNLTEDIDFAETDETGELLANITVATTDSSGNPASYVLSREGLCISGEETSDRIRVENQHVPFRELTLINADISDIISVTDDQGNTYYQVETLSQDTVYRVIDNIDSDNKLVPYTLEIVPAPRRFIVNYDPTTRLTKIRFGEGDSDTLDDDIVPDPSELALPLYGKRQFSRFSIDPNSLLNTQTLGISPKNTTLTVRYRYGGGLKHNVSAGTIRILDTLSISFPEGISAGESAIVRSSIEVKNLLPAAGGDLAPTLEDLRSRIPSARQSQSRIVSRQDLLARIYAMPNEFGRVFRAGISDNPVNPLSAQLHIISRDRQGNLAVSPDSLKRNLSKYLNEFRLISDAFDILDARVSNYTVKFGVMTAPGANKNGVIQNVIARLKNLLKIDNFQIDQPIVLDDLINVIINTQGVVSLLQLDIEPKTGTDDGRLYSNYNFDFANATRNKIITAPRGTIFELKYPDFDIIGTAI